MIAQAIRKMTATEDEIYSVVGKVTAVDESARTCDVEPLNGDAALFDIRLQAEQSASEGVVLIPAVGSWVIVTFTSKADGYVAERSRVEKILWGIGSNKMEYSADGFRLENAQTDLKSELSDLVGLFNDLLTTLQTFTVATAVGPSTGVMPPTLTDIIQYQVKLQALKPKLESLLK